MEGYLEAPEIPSNPPTKGSKQKWAVDVYAARLVRHGRMALPSQSTNQAVCVTLILDAVYPTYCRVLWNDNNMSHMQMIVWKPFEEDETRTETQSAVPELYERSPAPEFYDGNLMHGSPPMVRFEGLRLENSVLTTESIGCSN